MSKTDSKVSSANGTSSHQRFVCPLRFNNDLPDLPFDPKLLEYPFDPERHFIYRPNTLEKEEKQQMLPEPDLGIPINLIDPLAYFCTPESKELGLDEEDKELLNDHHKSDIVDETIASWIKPQEYLVADFGQETIYGFGNTSGGMTDTFRPPTLDNDLCLERDVEVHIEAVERTFLEATTTPIHPTDPELTAVEVLEFIPGFDLWPYEMMHIDFQENPAPKWPDIKDPEFDMKVEEQKDLALCSIIVPMQSDDGLEFAAFLTPKWGDYEDLESFNDLDINDREYTFTREYTLQKTGANDKRNIFITVNHDKQKATYNQVACRFKMKKKPSQHQDHFPETIKLTSIEPTGADRQQIQQRLSAIQPKILVDADDAMMGDIGEDEEDDEDMEEIQRRKDLFGDDDSDED